jgi:hypothetical protein
MMPRSNSLTVNLLSAAVAFLAFLLAAVIGPGLAIQRLLRVRADPALATPVGIAAATAAGWLAWRAGQPALFAAPLLLLDVTLVLAWSRGWSLEERPYEAVLPAALGLVTLFAATQYQANRLDPAGDLLLDPLLSWDTALHVALARELTLPHPPQVPMLAGVPLSYHYGADMLRALALEWAGVDPYDSISRFDLTAYALALALLLATLAARLGAPPFAVRLAPLALLATDFSFLYGGAARAHWWADEFRGNLLLSLALGNPVVPALVLALGALVALDRHEHGDGAGFLWLAGLQAAALPFFKSFTGGHLGLSFALAALLTRGRARRAAAILAALTLAATGLMALSPAAARVTIGLAPLDLVQATRAGLGLPPISGAGLVLWAAVWLVVSLGLRTLGIAPALAFLRSGSASGAAAAALALTAWPLGMSLSVSAQAAPGDPVINNANFFLEHGALLLWVFAALGLARLAGERRRLPVAVLAAGLALPSTVQFAVKKAGLAPDRIDANVVAAMQALARVSRPGDVVLQRPGASRPPPPVILIGRRVPYERFSPFLAQFAPPEVLAARHEAVLRFFRATDPAEALSAARALNARFLCLYDSERVRFDPSRLLSPIFQSPEARCYEFLDGVRS